MGFVSWFRGVYIVLAVSRVIMVSETLLDYGVCWLSWFRYLSSVAPLVLFFSVALVSEFYPVSVVVAVNSVSEVLSVKEFC